MEPSTESNFLIPAPAGQLEIATTTANKNSSPITIICHPHPLYGGTMQNKVVTTLAKTFQELEFSTVRFNFRGIGKSTGSYDNGIGEAEDLRAIINWVKQVLPNQKIYLAGFSFGACIAIKVATEIVPEELICVAPGVEHFDVSTLQVPCPWILIQGTADEVVPPHLVYAWAKTQHIQPEIIEIEGASHFFHGKLVELRDRLIATLKGEESQ
jgi:uncharacterized protein